MKTARNLAWLTVWIAHVGLWLIYVSQISLWEVLVGSAAAALATVGMATFLRLGLVKCRPSLRQIAEGWRIPWYVVRGTWEITQAIWNQLFSKSGAASYLAAVPFDAGPDDPECAGRRALAVLYTTMTPNFVVIGIVREQRLLLFHQILPGEILPMTRNLGANP